jgi:hypothetical protein
MINIKTMKTIEDNAKLIQTILK